MLDCDKEVMGRTGFIVFAIFATSLLIGRIDDAKPMPATTLSSEAQRYLQRAENETAQIGNQVIRCDSELRLIQIRAGFDTPLTFRATIDAYLRVLAEKQKLFGEVNTHPELKNSYLYSLGNAYARSQNRAAAEAALHDTIVSISLIPTSDEYWLCQAWSHVAELHFLLKDVPGSITDLKKIEPPEFRAESAVAIAITAQNAGRPADAQAYFSLAQQTLDKIDDPQWQKTKQKDQIWLWLCEGNFVEARKQIDSETNQQLRLNELGSLAVAQQRAGRLTESAKTLRDVLAFSLSDKCQEGAAINRLADRFAALKDRVDYEKCVSRAEKILSAVVASNSSQSRLAKETLVSISNEEVEDEINLGDFDKANSRFHATTEFATDVEAWGWRRDLIISHAAAGRVKEAAEELLSPEFEPKTTDAIEYLAARMVQVKQFGALDNLFFRLRSHEDRAHALIGAAEGCSAMPLEEPAIE